MSVCGFHVPNALVTQAVLTTFSFNRRSVITKPKEFAHLIRNKFGSADNISHIRSLEGNSSNSGAPDEFFVTSPSSSSALNAGNSSSLPGHGSQVRKHFL